MTTSLADLVITSASKQYIRVPISDAQGTDMTSDPVAFAFPTPGGLPTTFYSGSWITIAGIHYALCLVGPGTTAVLTDGFYDVYVKVTDNPETPVLLSGVLEVT